MTLIVNVFQMNLSMMNGVVKKGAGSSNNLEWWFARFLLSKLRQK